MHLPISQLKKEPIQFSSSKILSIHQYSTLHLLFIYAVAQQRYLSKLYRTVLLILLKEYTLNWLDDFFYWHSFLFNLNVLKPPIILIILLVHFFILLLLSFCQNIFPTLFTTLHRITFASLMIFFGYGSSLTSPFPFTQQIIYGIYLEVGNSFSHNHHIYQFLFFRSHSLIFLFIHFSNLTLLIFPPPIIFSFLLYFFITRKNSWFQWGDDEATKTRRLKKDEQVILFSPYHTQHCILHTPVYWLD